MTKNVSEESQPRVQHASAGRAKQDWDPINPQSRIVALLSTPHQIDCSVVRTRIAYIERIQRVTPKAARRQRAKIYRLP